MTSLGNFAERTHSQPKIVDVGHFWSTPLSFCWLCGTGRDLGPILLAKSSPFSPNAELIGIDDNTEGFDCRPLDEGCDCMVCKKYTRAFLHNLVSKGLPFASNLVSYHNVAYMQNLCQEIRDAIKRQEFPDYVHSFVRRHYPNPVRECSLILMLSMPSQTSAMFSSCSIDIVFAGGPF